MLNTPLDASHLPLSRGDMKKQKIQSPLLRGDLGVCSLIY